MSESHAHAAHTSHSGVVKRLKRAHGHLQNVITMIESERACLEIAQQLHAVERALNAAKKLIIHDHLDHCLQDVSQGGSAAVHASVAEFKDITKYL